MCLGLELLEFTLTYLIPRSLPFHSVPLYGNYISSTAKHLKNAESDYDANQCTMKKLESPEPERINETAHVAHLSLGSDEERCGNNLPL